MKAVLSVLLAVIVMIVGVWIVIFGGIGAVLARARGGSKASGFLWGTFLGPVGWAVIAWRTRGGRAKLVTVEEWSGADPGVSLPATPATDSDLGHRI